MRNQAQFIRIPRVIRIARVLGIAPVVRVALAAAAAAGLVACGVAGCASAGLPAARPQPPASAPVAGRSGAAGAAGSGSASSAAAGPGGSGTARFIDYQDNDGPTASAVVTGAIGDYGKAVRVSADGTASGGRGGGLKFTLSRGSFRLDIASLDSQLLAAFGQFPADHATCSGVVSVTHRAPVVTGSGTGAYRGISGTFDVTVTIAEVDAKLHCGPSSPFLGQQVVMSGTGTVTFGTG